MRNFTGKIACFLLLSVFLSFTSFAQQTGTRDSVGYKTISAGPQYKKNAFYQKLWGSNYRKEWILPVSLPIMHLDTLRGGLVSYKEGGSNQSKSLHLTTKGDKQYTLRSVDKTLYKVIPKIFHNTFVANIVNDEISMSHPYGALGVAGMADAVKIYHTNPVYYYLPEQKALDTLNKKYAGKVYLFEQRPKGNWSNADNLGNFEDYEDTDDMLKKIFKDNDKQVDQEAFARARLFDMLIADFDRHQDQWKWGVKKEGNKTTYIPVPTDRDQAYFIHNGVLLNLVISVAGLKFLQSYDYTIHNVKSYAFVNRILDRLLTNKMTLTQWETIAKDIQVRLTDDVIAASISQMPKEIFAIRGNELIEKMKSRRSHLAEYAKEYYLLLAKETEIVGTKDDEYFEIINPGNDVTTVNVYKLKNGTKQNIPFYTRSFTKNETEEIRIYGLSGNDIYKLTGPANKKIALRIIGGDMRDSVINEMNGKGRLQVYDNYDNYFAKNANTRLHLSKDSAVHKYYYNSFLPDKKGFAPHLGFNDNDRLFAGLRYTMLNHRWRKLPYASKNTFDVDYSIFQKALSTTYNGYFPKRIGKWDIFLQGNYDQVRWINFFGLGNETVKVTDNINFYRMRSEEGSAAGGLYRTFKKSNLRVSATYRLVKILDDTARFVSKVVRFSEPNIFTRDYFAGLEVAYNFADVKDSVLPQKGITFSAKAKHTQNLALNEKSFQRFTGIFQFFIPIVPKFSLAVKTGASAITGGSPLFYQYPSIGESFDLRGFRRERFSGRSTFYNSTELRFIGKVRSYIFNGKAGLMAFADNGRVWMPDEKSSIIHTSYGGGILLAPFNLVSAAVTYGISKEQKMLQIRLGVLF